MTLAELRPIALDLAVATAGLLVLGVDLALPERWRRHVADLAAALVLGIFVASFFVDGAGSIHGVYVGSEWTVYFKRIFLVSALLAVVGGRAYLNRHATTRAAEYCFLVLMSTTGMMLLPGAHDFLFLIVAFELMGIPLYVLAAYAREPDARLARSDEQDIEPPAIRMAAEAGLKFYLVGAASTVLTLFGLSLVVGVSGATRIDAIMNIREPLGYLGMMLVLAGMGFKIGAVPFHMWVPDTYQGAPTPVVAFLSVAPKAAGIATLSVVFGVAFASSVDRWLPAMLALCVAAMVVGNLLAIPQTNAKRLLAYSGIAQMGYMLMALVTGSVFGLGMLLFYLAGYVATNMGVFLVVHAVIDEEGDGELSGFAGLAKRSPWLGLSLLMFLLSLAGIPFVVGFWAKLYVFMAAWRSGLEWLVVIGAVLAVVGLFYYLQLARSAYMAPPKSDAPVVVAGSLRLAIVLCLLAVVGMGAWPKPFLDSAQRAAEDFRRHHGSTR